jgi:hypothetical protein
MPGYFLAAVAKELEFWLGKMLGLQAYLGAFSTGVVATFVTFLFERGLILSY